MNKKKNRDVLKFLQYLTKLEIIEAIGIARLLGVELVTREDGTDADDQEKASLSEKDYDVILSEIIDAFVSTSKSKRKFILSLMEASVKQC